MFTSYIRTICMEKDNVLACQFHPEKSSSVGLRILKNFIDLEVD